MRRALAHGLAEFVTVGRALGLDQDPALQHPMAMPADALFPDPHSARFDFAATAAGAEWIDALATRARRVLDAARLDPPVLVHGDWRIENVNVAAGAVVAIYDWDSVCTEPEIFAVANAMVTHSVDWSRPVGEHFPANAAMPQLPHRLRGRTRRGVRGRPAPRHRGAHGVPPRLRCPVRARDLVPGGRRLPARAPAPPR